MTAPNDPGDQDTLARIHALVTEEHRLRELIQQGDSDPAGERLRSVETQLDQCWDLLRQRRALREAGADPDEASVRPADEVQRYLS